MAREIVMPKLAMAMSEGTINDWKFATGDLVEAGQILLDIETEKVSYEIEATGSGYLQIVVPEGETVPVEQVIAYLSESLEEQVSLDGLEDSCTPVPAVKTTAEVTTEQPVAAVAAAGSVVAKDGRIIASPLAKKLAVINEVDLSQVDSTGPNGRIVKRDVLAAVENRKKVSTPALAVTTPTSDVGLTVKATVPLTGMRKVIADNMMLSLSSTAQLTSTNEFDATELVQLRKRLLAKEEKLGLRISYNDIFSQIVARAARKVPIVNASIVDDEIRIWEEINLGIAIAIEISEYASGLYVPVVKNAGRKSLFEIASEIKTLTAKARGGELTPADMSDGTLTLSSAAFSGGLVCSTPILNPGQALLVQPGPIQEKAVVRNGEVVIRQMMSVNFTFDHRIIDGVPIGKFAKQISELMECPELLL